MTEFKVTVSCGNSKVGKMLNVSLPPIITCRRNSPCARDCYANNHAYRLYKGVREAWDGNLAAYRFNPDAYFFAIHKRIKGARDVKYFRWHVGGDIPEFDYTIGMDRVASGNPDVTFLCFTKQYELVDRYIQAFKMLGQKVPVNLKFVLSAWPGLKIPAGLDKKFPVAWMRDCKSPDPRIPAKAQECPGGCDKCGLCFGLKKGNAVAFDKH